VITTHVALEPGAPSVQVARDVGRRLETFASVDQMRPVFLWAFLWTFRRDRKVEAGPLTGGALDSDMASVRFDDAFRDRKTEACA
jgi:hypothetical protein